MPDKSLSALKKFEEIVAACNRCGFCTSYCPTYNATGNEIHSPRGRNQLFRALIEGKVQNPSQIEEAIDTCLLCGECTSVCFSEVPTAKLMVQARHYLEQVNGVPPFLAAVLTKLLPRPKILARTLKVAFWMKRLGFSWTLKKLGVLKRVSPMLETADDLMPRVPTKFLMEFEQAKRRKEQFQFETRLKKPTSAAATPASAARPKIAYMPACGSQYLKPEIGLATLALFDRLKVDVTIPDVVCCGLPATSTGVMGALRSLASTNITVLEKERLDSIVIDDSSCTAQMKELVPAFPDDPAFAKRAFDLSQKVRDVSTFFLQRGLKDHLKLTPWGGEAVAFHDPCKAQYGLKSTLPPRELLAAIPRIKLVTVAEADQCCGGAGTFGVTHPDMSRQILDAKVKNIVSSGCKIVVTSSASCLIQLQFGLRRINSTIEAMHLTEFLMRALEKRK